MRVWVYPERTFEDFGSERWVCEWQTQDPKWKPHFDDDTPDPAIDMISHRKFYKAKAPAMAEARRRMYDDFYGSAVVYKECVDWYVEEDRVAHWVSSGEPIYVDE